MNDQIYCPHCGTQINRAAMVCTSCGMQNMYSATPQPYTRQAVPGQPVPKDKTVAILLAVFLAFWTWLYTYQRDGWKFWVNLALSVLTLGFWVIVAWIWAIIDVAVKPDSYYHNFPNG